MCDPLCANNGRLENGLIRPDETAIAMRIFRWNDGVICRFK